MTEPYGEEMPPPKSVGRRLKVLGISREPQNSPNRESDDALILKTVMDQFSETTLMTPEEFDRWKAADRADTGGYDLIVPMCEAYPRLMRLKSIEAATGVVVVNPADSVLGCYRARMFDSFAKTLRLSYPPTAVRRTTAAANKAAPAFEAEGGWWLKRGDVHSTCADDVVFAHDWKQAMSIRREFNSREIMDMAIQRHIDGDLIKFYGVGPGQWFTWFYHDPSDRAIRLPFERSDRAIRAGKCDRAIWRGNAASKSVGKRPASTRRWKAADLVVQTELAARAVKVSVFGGDAIVAPDGTIFIIDINSWPSFARVRAEAAVQIARHLRLRLRQESLT